MQYFQALGATAPKFFIGDRVLTSVVDPDEGLFTSPAIIAGLVWDSDHWDYAVMFEGYESSDFGWLEAELSPLTVPQKTSNQPLTLVG